MPQSVFLEPFLPSDLVRKGECHRQLFLSVSMAFSPPPHPWLLHMVNQASFLPGPPPPKLGAPCPSELELPPRTTQVFISRRGCGMHTELQQPPHLAGMRAFFNQRGPLR